METTVEPQAQRRLTLVVWGALTWGLILGGRLVQLQMVEYKDIRQVALRQQEHTVEVQAARGTIYSGGEGGGPLALSIPIHRVAINPLRVATGGEAFVASILQRFLGVDSVEVLEGIAQARKAKRGYMVVAEDATLDQIARLKRSKLDIFTFEDTYRREYPKGRFASHVLGWVNFDGHGDAGAERGLEEELRGVPGRMRMLHDSRNRDYHGEVLNEEKPEPGVNIWLTIDEAIQHTAEKALREAIEKERVPSGSIVVLDPKTGDILAMASYPAFDPRERVKDEMDMLNRMNLTIAAPFEPGSVFKAVTIAAALETTRLRPESIINCGNGLIRFPGRVIKDHDPYSALSMTGVLANSSNVGAINIGLTVGNPKMHQYMHALGFGSKTGISLPGESAGVVHPLKDWGATSMGSVAMGHEMLATPLQLAQAFGIIANNGILIQPRLVLARQRGNEPRELAPVADGERRLKPQTAIELRRMLEQVILDGTGKTARLKGYTAGGKTGTAQMVDVKTGKYIHRYNSSFVGFAPLANPSVVVSVTINGSYKYGGESAAPVFREVALAALRTRGVPKDLPEEAVPLVKPEMEPEPKRDGPAVKLQYAKAEAPVAEPAEPEIVSGIRVPDFSGMTMRAVIEKSAAEGWRIDPVGRGIARGQQPAPGSVVSAAARIRVTFRQ